MRHRLAGRRDARRPRCAHEVLDLGQEPRIVGAGTLDLGQAQPLAERLGDQAQPVRCRPSQRGEHRLLRPVAGKAGHLDLVQARQPSLQAAQGLLQRFLEGPAHRHDLAHRLHGGGEQGLGLGEFLEGEARDLGDDVVDRRLEGGRSGAGDVVLGSRPACSRPRAWLRPWRSGNPVAFDARAELRDTRGFISITTIRPVAGSSANWTLEPPVSTPISRRPRSRRCASADIPCRSRSAPAPR